MPVGGSWPKTCLENGLGIMNVGIVYNILAPVIGTGVAVATTALAWGGLVLSARFLDWTGIIATLTAIAHSA
jgi:hypothetical protein